MRPAYRERPRLALNLRIAGGAPIRAASHEPVPVTRATDDGTTVAENQLVGNPSVMGRVYPIGWGDGEVIFPGAFAPSLERFRREGFIAMGHSWRALPIAFPTLIEERGANLYAEATYHSHSDAQDARAVAMERIAAGLTVGLSIGFYVDSDSYFWFESGQKLLAYAGANGYDLSLFDQAGILAWDGWIMGILKIEHLIEYSQVTIPANDTALATEARGKIDPPEVLLPALTVPPTGTRQETDPAVTQRIRSLRVAALTGAIAPGETA